ncbi:class I SAM-dependent methyltransferase [Candidatus Clostridium radicumherbarum]|uniref:Class I SAM-dependent methyltransferase n=1 Tax=Candidatus Clostridium radicumherbarum TaxID=3381662 RepID=A0ABW8TRR4_9CLOT
MDKLKKILVGESKNLKVLDIGTGVGSFIEVLQESLPGYISIIGIDTKKEVLNKAAEKYKDKRIKFMHMDGEKIEFKNNSIDVISISNTLHHLPNKEKILCEIKRVLKPKGIIIINEMISDNQSEKQLSHVKLHHLQAEIDTLLGIYHNRTFTEHELVNIVASLNLENVDMFQYNTHEEQEKSENLEDEKGILDQCFQAVESKIEKISNVMLHEMYLEVLENLRSKLYNIGFFTATELIIVCRKI